MGFRTKINFQDNRQHKLPERESHILSGVTEFGVPFSALTSGPDPEASGISSTSINIISTFSGNTGTTNFTFGLSKMDIAADTLSAITPSNSAITQNTGFVYVGNVSQIVDGNSSFLSYSGVSFAFNVTGMTETGVGLYTGSGISIDVDCLTAGTLDFTGRTIWTDNAGISKTKKLIVSDGAITGYVLVASNNDGDVVYSPVSAITSGDTYTTGATLNGTNLDFNRTDSLSAYTVSLSSLLDDTNFYVTGTTLVGTTLYYDRTDGLSAFTSNLSSLSDTTFWVTGDTGTQSFKSTFGTGLYNGGDYSMVAAGRDNIISGTTSLSDSVIVGGNGNIIESNSGVSARNGIFVGQDNVISGTVINSSIIGGRGNTIGHENSHIIGLSGITTTETGTTYVQDLTVIGTRTVMSDSFRSSDISTFGTNSKGSIIYFDTTGSTSMAIVNANTLGKSSLTVGSNMSGENGAINYYGSTHLRGVGTGTTGDDFYQNKVVIVGSTGVDGMVIKPVSNDAAGILWFELNAQSVGILNSDAGYWGFGLNQDGTELPTSHVQIGGTGTTGTFQYLDGNEASGFVLTSDASGNVSWAAASGGGGGGTANTFTTGATLIGDVAYFDRTDSLSAFTLNLSGFSTTDNFVTGGTLDGTLLVLNRTDVLSGATVDLSSLSTFTHTGTGTITPTNAYSNANTSDYSSVLGGTGNIISGTSTGSSIIGGGNNNILTSLSSIIGGGSANGIYNNHYGTVGGGWDNSISGTSEGGGALYATIGGGYGNLITGDSDVSFIGGGKNNTIIGGDYSIIGGGKTNIINSGATYSSVIGGSGNTINHVNSHIIGSNITSVSADTTHVEKLNVGTLNGTSINVALGLDVNGMVVSGNTSSDNYTTGTTLVGTTLYYDRNDTLSAYTSNLSSLLDDTNFYVTGGTVFSDTMYLDRTDTLSAATIDVSSLTQSGTTNYISKFDTDPTNLVISQITDDGTTVSINNTSPATGFTFYVSGDTKVVGSFEADSKSFDIQHPSDPSKRLRYGSLEGPEYGVYVRGKVNGDNVINLPAYWKDLIHEDSITVQLTPFGKSQNLFVGNVNTSSIEVLGDDSPQYYYVVYGERKDIDKITVEY